ncbi:toll/interleukin-1 receptor domain-containing protein [Streptomyces corynorhini]|uniref:Toll/interleukin-1 receptor domain-containing protein n=1 Tax=Streptomyces corynorhini TaxID=2282652 RepID=A0A370BHV9_9ACTN|nr:toll/interleukin-1 receptor domain-containing protein [Streptomyces corynorhini]RDG39844.1 toll/interleukin-1 receptor domain-containing protein [Streptomyces corynorhini]
MTHVFINYRTHDGEETAVALEQALTRRFGEGRIFRASSSIKPGQLFDEKLLTNVANSSVLVAVIGRHWAESPQLHERGDWVRKEILEAFRSTVTVMPVLVGRETERLRASALPSVLRKLARLQSFRYDTQNAEYDLRRIGDELAVEVPALAEAEAALARQRQPAEPGSVHNTMGSNSGGTNVQTRDITGDIGGIGGTVIRESNGPLHTGPGDQHHHEPRLTGDGSSYVAGDQHDGGNRNTFGDVRRRRDDDR